MKRLLYCILFVTAAVISYAETNLSNVYVLYADNVLDFSEDGIAENIVDGKLVRYSMLDLKVGDVFIDTDGEAKKVAAIIRNGSDITIETVAPTIDEFFQFVRVPNQEVDLAEYAPDYRFERSVMASDGSIVTMTPMDDISQSFDPNESRGPADGNMLGKLMEGTSWTNLSISVNLKDPTGFEKYQKYMENKNLPNKASKSGKVSLDIAFGSKTITNKINPDFEYSKPTIKWKKVWRVKVPYPGYTTGHGRIKVDFDEEVGYAFKLAGQASISKEIPLWGAPNPAGAYAYLFARPSFSFNVSALYQRYYRMTYKREMGVEFVSIIPISKVTKQDWDLSVRGHYLEGAIDATGEVMFGVRAGVKVTGFTVLEGCVQGGPYVNVHVGATALSLTWSSDYETLASQRPEFNDQRYEKYLSDWEKTQISENLPGLSYAMTFGLKYSANLTVLNFFNWTPFSGSWKIFEIGSNGTVVFGKKVGKK